MPNLEVTYFIFFPFDFGVVPEIELVFWRSFL